MGLSFEKEQVDKARDFLIGHRRADPLRLRFEHRNLYDLDEENRTFDEIICFEVLEHLGNDEQIVKQFFRILKPGGFLHLCTPNRLHPRNQAEILDLNEKGGHIRAGYTEEDYRRLLEPVGFQVEKVVGIGPHSLYVADTILRVLRNKLGDVAALPFLPLALPFVWFARMNPPVPFSIYVRARK